MKAIRKRQTGFVVLLVLLAAAAIFTYAYARTESNPVTYTDHQRFRSDITVNSPMASNRSEVNIGGYVDIDFESGSDTDIESGATIDVNAGAIFDINTGYSQYMTSLTFVNTNAGDYTNGTGWTITNPATNGTIIRVDLTGVTDYVGSQTGVLGAGLAGVTLNLPTVTELMDGWEITIIKIDSGTSELVPYSSVPLGNASGTTPGANVATYVMNAQGDAVTLIADYNSAVSWWIKSAVIH